MTSVRNVKQEDLPALKTVLDSSGLFPAEYLDDMIADYFNNPESTAIWLTAETGDQVVAIAFCAPETFTEGTWNLYAIGVMKELQGKGIGRAIMGHVEQLLSDRNQRVLIVETSSDPQFELTRKFYTNLGYNHEATIRDFWAEGDDKVIFWKKLG